MGDVEIIDTMEAATPLEEMPSLVFEQPNPKPIVDEPISSSDDEDSEVESVLSDAVEQTNGHIAIFTPEAHEEEDDGLDISSSSSEDADGESEDGDFELESQHEVHDEDEEAEDDEHELQTTKPSRRPTKHKADMRALIGNNPDLYGLRRSVCGIASIYFFQ